jgi:hypothetical protein
MDVIVNQYQRDPEILSLASVNDGWLDWLLISVSLLEELIGL